MAAETPAIVTVIGRDQKGVVATVCTYLAEQQINIEHIDQKVMEGLFIMTMLVDLRDVSVSLDRLILDLKEMGEKLNMEVSVRLHGERQRKRVAVLVSKERHCLEEIAKRQRDGRIHADIAAVLSNHEVLGPLAEDFGLPFRHFPSADKAAHMDFVRKQLDEIEPDLVVLARYMQILPESIVSAYSSRIVNIHPSLLPYYPGANAYKQAFEAGVRVCGCTAHFVTKDLDQGPVILQDVFHINVGEDGLDEIKAKGAELEAQVLARAVELFLNDELLVSGESKVLFKPGKISSGD